MRIFKKTYLSGSLYLLLTLAWSLFPVSGRAGSLQGRDSKETILGRDSKGSYDEELCSALTDFDFQFFDKSFSLADWDSAKQELSRACQNWNNNKQDFKSINELSKARDNFLKIATEMPDRMLAATVQRLGPARDQQKTGNCFGHAVADLVGYNTGRRVSAFSAQVRASIEAENRGTFEILRRWALSESRFTNGEYLQDAMVGALKGPVCPEDQPNGSVQYSNADLLTYWENYEKGLRTYFGPTAPMQYINPILASLGKLAPSLDAQDFVKNFKRSERGDIALGSWLDRHCNIRANGQIFGKGKPVIDNIKNGLRRKAPVAIGYEVRFIGNGQQGSHASSIVAESRIKGKTEFLLRNSWGPDCGHYNPVHRAKCKEGHIWVTEEELGSNSYDSYYYK